MTNSSPRCFHPLQRDQRVPYRILKRHFNLDDEYIEDLKLDLIEAKPLAIDENDSILVWVGASGAQTASPSPPVHDHKPPPISYTCPYR